MKKVLIFGTGSTGRRIYAQIKDDFNVIGFLDNDASNWGKDIDGIKILGNGSVVKNVQYDEILVCSLPGMKAIQADLLALGVPGEKINCEYIVVQVNARINFLNDLSELCENSGEDVSVAEGGCYQGDFAKEINRCFPDKKLYLFDTFAGLDERDTKTEHAEGFSIFEKSHLSRTSAELVMQKMYFPEKVEIRAGYFPETVKGLENEKFFFVNLDFDMYAPTLAGLQFFYERLVKSGVILIHDYYNPGYKGIKAAVDDYEKANKIKLCRLPIGDHCSIAIIKT